MLGAPPAGAGSANALPAEKEAVTLLAPTRCRWSLRAREASRMSPDSSMRKVRKRPIALHSSATG
eukprot:6297035-Prymnesium_polylepis.1